MNQKMSDRISPETETIVAVATPPGEGGIGIVRLSGPHALAIGRRLFSFAEETGPIEPYRLYPGTVTVPDTPSVCIAAEGDGRMIVDRALFVAMPAPRSYTGENVVELQCHGAPLLLSCLVTAAVSLGARPARHGEFTERAFLNGKIDLVQAEAVADLISATTVGGLSLFSRHHMGGLSDRLSDLKSRLVNLSADIEASVDFSDQDIDPPAIETVVRDIEQSLDGVGRLLESYRVGRIYREGARLVIAGRPNVGKSSLLNRFLGYRRAIVAPDPGTTTDTIEDGIDIGGVPVRIVDTCGLREATGAVEREGVARTRQAIETADVTLLVADATEDLGRQERTLIETAAAAGRGVVLVMNKVDLAAAGTPAPPNVSVPVVFTSAMVGTGIDQLKDAIGLLIAGKAARTGQEEIITNARHYAGLLAIRQSLREAREGAGRRVSPEFIALDIRAALSALGELTGEVTTDELLEAVFSRFCVGK